MKNQNNRPCPICFSQKFVPLYEQAFSGHFSHNIVKCYDCGFVYVNNTPPQAFYDKYYTEESKYEGVRQHEAHEMITKRVLLQFLRLHVHKNAEILDVGCSTGSFLAFLKNRGYAHVVGIDPAPECKRVAKEKYGILVETKNIDNHNPKKKFDVVILSQVLEHLVHVRTSIGKIRSFLKDDGYLFIGVPDAGRFHQQFVEPFGEFSTEHINFFTEDSLGFVMRGFDCVLMKSDGKALFSSWKNTRGIKNPMQEYIRKSTLKQERVNRVINSLPKKVIVWGVGALTRRLLLTTSLKKRVKFFVDSSPNLVGKKIEGLNIEHPDVLRHNKEPVFIASYKFHDEIRRYVVKKKYTNNIYSI